jgi:hypothetical protein
MACRKRSSVDRHQFCAARGWKPLAGAGHQFFVMPDERTASGNGYNSQQNVAEAASPPAPDGDWYKFGSGIWAASDISMRHSSHGCEFGERFRSVKDAKHGLCRREP